jgi:Fe2+ or Zn2+ uptake regulation protein
VLEFEEPELNRLETHLAREYGYRIKSHQLQVHGLCATCQEAK